MITQAIKYCLSNVSNLSLRAVKWGVNVEHQLMCDEINRHVANYNSNYMSTINNMPTTMIDCHVNFPI